MATPIPLHQPTQYPSTLALAAIPSFHGLVHHMCVHHTLSHRPLSTFMGTHTHTSTFCQLSSTLHPPNAYGPPPSTLHQFFHLFTIDQLWPTLPMSYACSTVAWGVLCTAVG